MDRESKPSPPEGVGPAGRRLWDSVVDEFDLEEHELALLVEATRSVDLLDELDEAIRRDGALTSSPQGTKAHPAVVESRQQKIVLARVLAALRLPSGAEDDRKANAWEQRRSGARGVYGIRGLA